MEFQNDKFHPLPCKGMMMPCKFCSWQGTTSLIPESLLCTHGCALSSPRAAALTGWPPVLSAVCGQPRLHRRFQRIDVGNAKECSVAKIRLFCGRQHLSCEL